VSSRRRDRIAVMGFVDDGGLVGNQTGFMDDRAPVLGFDLLLRFAPPLGVGLAPGGWRLRGLGNRFRAGL
jgi:hypothetical protein